MWDSGFTQAAENGLAGAGPNRPLWMIDTHALAAAVAPLTQPAQGQNRHHQACVCPWAPSHEVDNGLPALDGRAAPAGKDLASQ